MIKLKTLLSEYWWPNSDPVLTIDDMENRLSSIGNSYSYPEKSMLSTIVDFYYGDNEEHRKIAINYIEQLNTLLNAAIKLTAKFPYFSIKDFKNWLLRFAEYKPDLTEYFPIPVEIAAEPDEFGDYAPIGVMMDKNGKIIELFEGNDEATPATIAMVNKLLHPSGKKVRIYGAHTQDLVEKIEMTDRLPENIYVSPNIDHAKSYQLDLAKKIQRTLFTGIIDINNVNQDSEIDWKTITPTKIEKFRILD